IGSYQNNWWADKNNTWCFLYTTHNYSAQLARCYFNTTHYWEDTSLLQNVSDIDFLRFGAHVGTPQTLNFNGSIDEIRIEKVDRSWEWVNTTYNTMNSPSTFYSVGGEETEPTPPKIPILDLQNIKGGVLGISVALVNSGGATAYDIKWEMNLSEISGYFFPKHANGDITQLEPGEEAIIDIGLMFGLGESTVTFYCEYTMILNDSRSELDIGVKQEWRDNGYLIFHSFPEGKQPAKIWRTLKKHEYEYTIVDDEKVVNFTLDPPQPLQLHNVRVVRGHDKGSLDITFLGACKLIYGEGQLKENWITKSMVESGDAYWEVELVNEPQEECNLTINNVYGGFLNTPQTMTVDAVLTNTGTAPCVNVSWSITFNGGIIFSGPNSGRIPVIPPGGTANISSNLVVGLALPSMLPCNVIVTATCPPHAPVTATKEVLVIFLLCMVS
ncbi:MAG: hypothetical protein JSW60_09215, partial [Thermoplasmatales archaeon]